MLYESDRVTQTLTRPATSRSGQDTCVPGHLPGKPKPHAGRALAHTQIARSSVRLQRTAHVHGMRRTAYWFPVPTNVRCQHRLGRFTPTVPVVCGSASHVTQGDPGEEYDTHTPFCRSASPSGFHAIFRNAARRATRVC